MKAVDVFEGVKEDGVFILNTKQKPEELNLPKNIKTVAYLDATTIALELLGRPITNTIMLGAFCKATGLVSIDKVAEKVEELWGTKNKEAVYRGFEAVTVVTLP